MLFWDDAPPSPRIPVTGEVLKICDQICLMFTGILLVGEHLITLCPKTLKFDE